MTTTIKLEDLSVEQRSLLLFLETRAVDFGGRVKLDHMNSDDMAIARKWAEEGFIGFGRVIAADHTGQGGTHWVTFSGNAWELAHEERRARCARLYDKREWTKTEEK